MLLLEMALGLLVWFALPLPLAVLVGRVLRAAEPEPVTVDRSDLRLLV